MIGLVCGLLSNLCFAVRNVITPASPAAAADSDALFLAINVIAAGKVFAAALVFAICTANLLLFLSAHPALTAALVSLWAALSRLLLSPSLKSSLQERRGFLLQ